MPHPPPSTFFTHIGLDLFCFLLLFFFFLACFFVGEMVANNEQRCLALPDDVLEQARDQLKNDNGSSSVVRFAASGAGEEPNVVRSPRRGPPEVSNKTPGA